jgi:hypothetical protein
VGEFTLSSEAFMHGGKVPGRHSCESEDVSSGLTWSDPPSRTRALTLIVPSLDRQDLIPKHLGLRRLERQHAHLSQLATR